MYCPKCNKKVEGIRTFCNTCGTRLIEDENALADNTQIKTESDTEEVVDNQSMVIAYVGNAYESIHAKGFSIWYFFFGVFYAIYRKMYLFGIFYIFASLLVLYIVPNVYLFLGGIVNIIISLFFNKMYLSSVSNTVEKIRKNNPNKNRTEILKICKSQGGANTLIAILSMIIVGYITSNKMMDMYSQYLDPNMLSNQQNYEKLEFSIPEGFHENRESAKKTRFTYEKDGEICDCVIEIGQTAKTAYHYLNRKTNYTSRDIKQGITEQTINNEIWNYLQVTTNTNTQYYDYAIIKDHILYNVVYKIQQDRGKCSSMKEEIIQSLKLKK